MQRKLRFGVIGLALAGLLPAARAQQRIFGKVEPNKNAITSSADVYDPSAGSFTPTPGLMVQGRQEYTAVLLRDGRVLFAGGYNGSTLSSAETFDAGSGLFTVTAGSMNDARYKHTATLLPDGRVLLAGGTNGSSYLNSAELFDPSSGTFSLSSSYMLTIRGSHTATLLSDGTVLLAGGYDGSNYLLSAEIYDPTAGTFRGTKGSMATARRGATATLLADGKVLIAGGQNADGYLNSAEIYDPGTGNFTAASGTMTAARLGHTATLLPDGKVLIAGGYNGSYLNSAEIYDPSTGKFTATGGPMATARSNHSAVAVSGGKVLLVGGSNGSYLSSAELYDPAAGSFTAVTQTMTVPRQLMTAIALPDGKVLVAGGQNAKLLVFDINIDQSDNVSPNIVFSSDSKTGYVSYTGSGVVAAFSAETGDIVGRIDTGGYPSFITPLKDGKTLAVVDAWDNKIFLIDTDTLTLRTTYTFANAQFYFGSILVLSPDGGTGYISSTGTGEVIKFSVSDGTELGRLKGLQAPAQVTLSNDGSILMVVDTSSEELDFANTSTMTQTHALKARDTSATADLTIFNKAVLTPEGDAGIVACRNLAGSLTSGIALIFKTGTGELLNSLSIGSLAGYTGITPDGQYWVILNEYSLSVIPTHNPNGIQDMTTAQGSPLGSATIAFSPDSKYAYYAASAEDLVFQHNIITGGVVGQVLVGDNPNKSLEQPATVAITPDGKTVAALEFVSNNIDLLTSVTTLEMPKFIISGDQFSGLSLVNLSDRPANISLYALDNYGTVLTADNLTNPLQFTLGPNAQISKNISELFNFDLTTEHTGRLQVVSDQPQVAGYFSVGQITAGWFSYYLNRMDGAPLFRDELYDWVVPEISTETGWSTQLNWVSTNYTQEPYDVKHFAKDGTLSEEKPGEISYPTNRLEQQFSDLFTPPGQGKILISGGTSASTTVAGSETYDLTARTFAPSSNLTTPRQGQTATLLLNGKVLVAGGKNGSTILSSAETYDLVTTKNISSISRDGTTFTVTLVFAGQTNWAVGNQLVVAGVQHAANVDAFDGSYSIVTISYDPSTGNTTLTYDQSSGNAGSGTPDTGTVTFNSGGSFVPTVGNMVHERYRHTATLLPSGNVLIAGGQNSVSVNDTAEIYDPTTNAFTATAGNMTAARDAHTATLLLNGKVLLAGGIDGNVVSSTAEIYDPATGLFTPTGSMTAARVFHTATLLKDGRVLVAGGYNGSYLNSAEIYDPTAGTFKATGSPMNSQRDLHTATLLSDGRVLIAGGTDGTNTLSSSEIYDPALDQFIPVAGAMTSPRKSHTATLYANPSDNSDVVLLVGGNDGTNDLNTAETFSPAAQAYQATGGTMTNARSGHTATLLQTTSEGYLRVNCKQGMIFSELYQGSHDGAVLNGIDMQKYVGVRQLFAPQFAITPSFTSRISLINGHVDQDAQVTLTLHAPDGRVLGTPATFGIPRSGKVQDDLFNLFQRDPSLQNTTGWLEVDSSVDQVVGTISFTNSAATFLTTLELSGNPLTNFVFPLAAEDGDYQTGIALLNSNDSTATLTMQLWGPEGAVEQSANVTLPPKSRTALYLSDFFPGLSPLLVGNIRIQSDLPVHSFSMVNDRSLHFIAAVPAIPIP